MRALFLPIGADPLAVEGDWNEGTAICAQLGAQQITAYVIESSCATCPQLGIWVDDNPQIEGRPVNVTASDLAKTLVIGNALIVGIGDDYEAMDLDEDELIRLAARVVLAEHKKLKQGEADE